MTTQRLGLTGAGYVPAADRPPVNYVIQSANAGDFTMGSFEDYLARYSPTLENLPRVAEQAEVLRARKDHLLAECRRAAIEGRLSDVRQLERDFDQATREFERWEHRAATSPEHRVRPRQGEWPRREREEEELERLRRERESLEAVRRQKEALERKLLELMQRTVNPIIVVPATTTTSSTTGNAATPAAPAVPSTPVVDVAPPNRLGRRLK